MLSKDIRQKRLERKWDQAELAKRLGVDVQTVSRWERGVRKPVAYHRYKLQSVLGLPYTEQERRAERRQRMQDKGEQPNTYFVQDKSNQDEIERIISQGKMFTREMGGTLPEQSLPLASRSALDVACGTGGWLIELAKSYPALTSLVGIDISDRMLDVARAQAKEARVADRVMFQTMDALGRLAFDDSTFDLVNLRFGVSFVRKWDWPKLFAEMARVLRSGGALRITDSHHIESNSDALNQLWQVGAGAALAAGNALGPEPDALTSYLAELMRASSFQDVSRTRYRIKYRPGTAAGGAFIEDMERLFQVALPFYRKWTQVPDNYQDVYQRMLDDMHHKDFEATWPIETVRATKP